MSGISRDLDDFDTNTEQTTESLSDISLDLCEPPRQNSPSGHVCHLEKCNFGGRYWNEKESMTERGETTKSLTEHPQIVAMAPMSVHSDGHLYVTADTKMLDKSRQRSEYSTRGNQTVTKAKCTSEEAKFTYEIQAQNCPKRGKGPPQLRLKEDHICHQSICLCPKIPRLSDENSSWLLLNLQRDTIGKFTTKPEFTEKQVEPLTTPNKSTCNVRSYCSVQNLYKENKKLGQKSFANQFCDREPSTVDVKQTARALCSFRFRNRDVTDLMTYKISSTGHGFVLEDVSSMTSVGSTISEPPAQSPHLSETLQDLHKETEHSVAFHPLCEEDTDPEEIQSKIQSRATDSPTILQPEGRDQKLMTLSASEPNTYYKAVRSAQSGSALSVKKANIDSSSKGTGGVESTGSECTQTDNLKTPLSTTDRDTQCEIFGQEPASLNESQMEGNSSKNKQDEIITWWAGLFSFLKTYQRTCPFSEEFKKYYAASECTVSRTTVMKTGHDSRGSDDEQTSEDQENEPHLIEENTARKRQESFEEGHPLRQFWQQNNKRCLSASSRTEDPCNEAVDKDDENGIDDVEPRAAQTASSIELDQNLRLARTAAVQNMTSGCQFMPWTGNLSVAHRHVAAYTEPQRRDGSRQRQDLPESVSGSGYCSTRTSAHSQSASETSGSTRSSFKQSSNHAERRSAATERLCSERKRNKSTQISPYLVNDSTVSQVPWRRKDISSTLDRFIHHKLQQTNTMGRKDTFVGTNNEKRRHNRSPLGHNKQCISPSSHAGSVCVRSTCARHALKGSSSEDSVLSETQTSSERSCDQVKTQTNWSYKEHLDHQQTSPSQQTKKREDQMRDKEPQPSMKLDVSAGEEERLLTFEASRAKENLDSQEVCLDVNKEDEFLLLDDIDDVEEDTEDVLLFDVVGSECETIYGLPPLVSDNDMKVSSICRSLETTRFHMHNRSNNTIVRSGSSSRELDKTKNNRQKEGTNRSHGSHTARDPASPDSAMTVHAEQNNAYGSINAQHNPNLHTIPVFSFHTPNVAKWAENSPPLTPNCGIPPVLNDNNPNSKKYNMQNTLYSRGRYEMDANSHTETVSKSFNKPKTSPTKKRTYVGPFSGFGSSQATSSNKAESIPNADTICSKAEPEPTKYSMHSQSNPARVLTTEAKRVPDDRSSSGRKSRNRNVRHKELSYQDSVSGRHAQEKTTHECSCPRDEDRCPEDKEQEEIDCSCSKDHVYQQARRLLRQICYLKSKEEMLYRAAIRFQRARLQLQEQHSLLFVKRRSCGRRHGHRSEPVSSHLLSTAVPKRERRQRKHKCTKDRRNTKRVRSDASQPRSEIATGGQSNYVEDIDLQQPCTSKAHSCKRSNRRWKYGLALVPAKAESLATEKEDGADRAEGTDDGKTEARDSKTMSSGSSVSMKATKTSSFSRDEEDEDNEKGDERRDGNDEDEDDDEDDDGEESVSSRTLSGDEDGDESEDSKSSSKMSPDGVSAHWQTISATPHQSGPSEESDSRSMPQSPRTTPSHRHGPEEHKKGDEEESETTDDDSNDPRLCGFYRQP